MSDLAIQPLVAAVLDAWSDLERVTDGMTDATAEDASAGSAHAWTVGHLAAQVDAWINVRLSGAEPDPLLGTPQYRFGADGRASGWPSIRDAATGIHERARPTLAALTVTDLDRLAPYPGTLPALAGRDVSLRHTLTRLLAHHYFHIGEIASKRSGRGDPVGDYPGPMAATSATDDGVARR